MTAVLSPLLYTTEKEDFTDIASAILTSNWKA